MLQRTIAPNNEQGPGGSVLGKAMFACTPEADRMLDNLRDELKPIKETVPLPQDQVSKIYSCLIYVGIDTGVFYKMLINAKKGKAKLTLERRDLLDKADFINYCKTAFDQTKSFQIYANLLIGYVFGRLAYDPKDYFKSIGFYLGKGFKEF